MGPFSGTRSISQSIFGLDFRMDNKILYKRISIIYSNSDWFRDIHFHHYWSNFDDGPDGVLFTWFEIALG